MRALIFAVVAAVLLLCGCGRTTPAERAMAQGILLLGNGPEPVALDPHLTTGVSEINIQRSLYEGLVVPGAEAGAVAPGVAESWDVSADGLTWRFELDPDARWSDGSSVVAEDFIAAWLRALEPQLAAPNAWMMHGIVGARAFNQGTGKADAVGLRSVGPGTLVVELERPLAYFAELVMHPFFAPIPHRLAAEENSAATTERAGAWAREGSFVGNGPFRLRTWQPGVLLEVEANPHYRRAGAVQLAGIRFMVFADPAAEERAFLANQLHITDSLPPQRVTAYRSSNDPRLRIDPYLGTYYILLNHRIAPLGDARVREALDLAIDKQALVNRILGAGQTPAWGFVPDSLPGYPGVAARAFDPQRARALLAEAGFPGGDNFPQLTYLFNTSESHRRIAEAIAGMWHDVLGIQIRIENVEWRTYLQRRESGDFAMARAVWIGDYAEPSTFLGLWAGGSANHWSGWFDSSYEAAYEAAKDVVLAPQRMAAYAEAEGRLMRSMPFVPLYHYVTVYLKQPYVAGWQTNLLDWPDYTMVHFTTAKD